MAVTSDPKVPSPGSESKAPQAASDLRRIGFRSLLAIVLVCLGGASGFLAARLFSARRPVLTESARLRPPDLPAAGAHAEGNDAADEPVVSRRVIPETVPDISLTDLDGVKRPLSQWKGRALAINFWATWCEPCRREIPLLKALRRERAGDGVEVIGIAVDFRDAVERYAHKMSIDYPVLVGEQDGFDAIAAFGMETVFPFTVFVDREGMIVTLKVGELHADEARYILDRVMDVDQGRMALPAARKAISDETATLAAERARSEQASAEILPPAVPQPR